MSANPNHLSGIGGQGGGAYPTESSNETLSCSQTPKKLRKFIRKYQYGLLQNPEFDIDLNHALTGVKMVDVGDVLAGSSRQITKQNLFTTVKELILSDAISFVVGGSNEMSYYNSLAALSVVGNQLGIVSISAQMSDIKILRDYRALQNNNSNDTTTEDSLATSSNIILQQHSHHSNNNLLTTQALVGSFSQIEDTGSLFTRGSSVSKTSHENICNGKYIRFAAQV